MQQSGTIQDYQSQFEKLLAKVGYLPPNHQVSSFVSGLRESIKADVQAARPKSLARVYVARNMSQRRVDVSTKEANSESSEVAASIMMRKMSPA